ncbi:MAG: hypothetical protein LBQ38_03910 [Spirochaetaceae bacterium]|jgi:hypothetical protein|nr:hypothetical protein [Spirochaetaceae bacterium]
MGWLESFARGTEKVRELLAAGGELLRTRRKILFISLGALALLLLAALLTAVLLLGRGSRGASRLGEGISEAFAPRPIPAEELFLPEEPDFLPGVILERERREAWTAEDAEPFWTDPLEAGPELYLDRIRGMIDEMMERVP